MRIRTYLSLMALSMLVPVILFSGIALRLLQNAELNAALGGLHEQANGVALLLDRDLFSAEAALQALGSSPSLEGGDLRAFHAQATLSRRGPDTWTVLTDRNGQQTINTARPFGSQLPPPFAGDVVNHVMDTGKTLVSDVLSGPLVRRPVTYLTVPVPLGQGHRYVLNAVFSTDHFKHLLDSVQVPPGWVVAIIDRQGHFVARNRQGDALVGQPAKAELVAEARLHPSGQLRHRTLEGVEVYDIYSHSSLSGWTVAVAAPVDLLAQAAGRAALVAGLGMLAAMLFAGGGAYWFGDKLVSAIQQAAQAAADLGNGRPPQIARSPVQEVASLNAALQAAGAQLLVAQQYRLHAENERRALLLREQEARRGAEEQNRAKDQFLAMLGHELRNPLAPISAAAQLLRAPSLDPKRVLYTSEVISRQVAHMNSLLQDLLDVSRVTRGLIALQKTPVEMAGIVADAVEQARDMIDAKGHQLTVHLPPEPVWVDGERTRLIQVLANLLNNAAKYTPAGGHIVLAMAVDGDAAPRETKPGARNDGGNAGEGRGAQGMVLLQVRDDGIGIGPDLLARVFELFSQAERSSDRSQGGLGLGLALVKSLVELHGGEVAAHSDGADQGSSFTVRLPRIAAPVHSAASVPALAPVAARPVRMLVVDDNVDAAESLALFLSEVGGHAVAVCHDGMQALEHVSRAAQDAPEVLILDIGLPDMDGYELVRRLRAMPQTANALIIALTGYGQNSDMEAALAAGFDLHLAKPVDPVRILQLAV